MKKIIAISLVLAAVIFIGMTRTSSAGSNKTNDTQYPLIHYRVVIHPNWTILHNGCPMIVAVTDGRTGIIGQPQVYQHGVNTYNFYEPGPVTGTRMAKLTNVAEKQLGNVCMMVSVSDTKNGTFEDGGLYVFNLYGDARKIVKEDNSTVKD